MPALAIISKRLRERPSETMAALGLISGVLSAVWGQTYDLQMLEPIATIFLLTPGAMPIGVFFGVALAVGMLAWTRKAFAAVVVLVTTLYAWSAAIHTAIRLQRNIGDDPHLVAASLSAGAVGAGLSHLGCALLLPELRNSRRILLTCAVGAVCGMLFYAGERRMLDERFLYLVWQPAVAFCIGLGLARDT